MRGPSSAEDSANSNSRCSVKSSDSPASGIISARVRREKENRPPEDLDNVRKILDNIRKQRTKSEAAGAAAAARSGTPPGTRSAVVGTSCSSSGSTQ